MNKKLLALLAVALGAPVALGAQKFDVKTPTDKVTEYIEQAYNIVGPVYEQNWPKGLEIYSYITTEKVPDINYLVTKSAELISNVLKNDKMRNMLYMIYKTDLTELVDLLMLGNAITIPPLAIPFAEKTLGYNRDTAVLFSNAMVDLASWTQKLYSDVYMPLIKDKLENIFATQSVAAISEKIHELIANPEVRAIVLDGLLNIKKHWTFISTKLGEFGFNAEIAERIVDNFYTIIKTIDNYYFSMPVTVLPGVPNIPGIEW